MSNNTFMNETFLTRTGGLGLYFVPTILVTQPVIEGCPMLLLSRKKISSIHIDGIRSIETIRCDTSKYYNT